MRAEYQSEIPPFSPRDALKGVAKAARLVAISRIDRKLPVGIEAHGRNYEITVRKNRRGTEVRISDDAIAQDLGQYTSIDISRSSGSGTLIVQAESFYYDDLARGETYVYDSNMPEIHNTMSLTEVLSRLRFVARATES